MAAISAPKIINRLKKEEDGATAVEFGIVAMPFFFLMFAIVEASLHFFAGQMLEHAVDNAARQLRTGQFDQTFANSVANTTTGTPPTQLETFLDLLKNNASGFFDTDKLRINVETADLFQNLAGPPPLTSNGEVNAAAYNFSVPPGSSIAMVTVVYEWPVFTNFMQSTMSDLSNGNALLTAIAIFRTE